MTAAMHSARLGCDYQWVKDLMPTGEITSRSCLGVGTETYSTCEGVSHRYAIGGWFGGTNPRLSFELVLEPIDGQPLTEALPGQFVVLRLRPAPEAPALLRSYSLSGEPSAERYRVSIKREAHSAIGTYIDDKLQIGDVLDVSAARGSFTLRPGDAPVVFLSAGIGGDPRARNASRVGGRGVAKGSLVAIRSPRPPRAPFCRGDACPPESFGPQPQQHSL
jgi:hypothetical protein